MKTTGPYTPFIGQTPLGFPITIQTLLWQSVLDRQEIPTSIRA